MPRIIHLLDPSGHVTVTWDQENNDKLLPAIDRMLGLGYKFFIVRDNSETTEDVEIVSSQDVASSRRVRISDEMLQQLHDDGFLTVGGFSLSEDESVTTGEIATDAETVVANETVATQPKSGG